jgi:hypothetical protein
MVLVMFALRRLTARRILPVYPNSRHFGALRELTRWATNGRRQFIQFVSEPLTQ